MTSATATTAAPKIKLILDGVEYTGNDMKEVNKKVRIARRDANRGVKRDQRRFESARFECYGTIGRLLMDQETPLHVVVKGAAKGFELAFAEEQIEATNPEADALALNEDGSVYALRVNLDWFAVSSLRKEQAREVVAIPENLTMRLESIVHSENSEMDAAHEAEVAKKKTPKK